MLKASILALLVALPGAAAAAPAGAPLLGLVGERPPMRLAHVDPTTLGPAAGTRVEVGSGGCAPRTGGEACWSIPPWTFSPDRAVLAVARNTQYAARSLRLVDVRSMRVRADIRIPGGGPVGGLAWLADGRVLAVQEVCCSEQQRVVAVDLSRRQVTARRSLDGSVLRLARTTSELVALLAPSRAVGAARLAVVNGRGAVRFARLERIAAGSKLLEGDGHRVDYRRPGLAVDPVGRRAFVVGASLIAEVELRSLAVRYHSLRLRAPAARAKEGSGTARMARWLGGGLLGVSGADEESRAVRPAGLLLVDTRDWTVRTIDSEARSVVVAGDLLLATGASGLSGYSFDGTKRFQLFAGDEAWVAQVHDGVAYVGIGGQESVRVVDLATGRVIGERTWPLPWLVVAPASGWWDG
jgi:hypothetical protein